MINFNETHENRSVHLFNRLIISLMKTLYFVLTVVLLSSCSVDQKTEMHQQNEPIGMSQSTEIIKEEFQEIFDSIQLNGSILIYDLKNDTYYSNDFKWTRTGKLPASTFKIPNSIIALETGVVENDSTLFEWDGQKRYMKRWEKDMIFSEALHLSCVPCYQDIARSVGVKKMKEHLDKMKYGSMKFDSTNLDMFWLEGDSKISQMEQIYFLKRLYLSELPISKRTEIIMKKMLIIEERDEYKLSGKTGWSVDNDIDNGWFVGYLEVKDELYFFATNVEPKADFDMLMFPKIRNTATMDAFNILGLY